MKKNGLTGKTDYDFSRALLELENLMDGASIKFILIGDVADRLKKEQKLDGRFAGVWKAWYEGGAGQ